MKKVLYFLCAVSVMTFSVNAAPDGTPKKKKPLIVKVLCGPLTRFAGGEDVRINGTATLKELKTGAYQGKGTLSVKISQARGGTILEEKDIIVKAKFDDILIATLWAVPDDKKSPDSKFLYLTLVQQNGDDVDPLPSEIQLKEGKTYMAVCDLEYTKPENR